MAEITKEVERAVGKLFKDGEDPQAIARRLVRSVGDEASGAAQDDRLDLAIYRYVAENGIPEGEQLEAFKEKVTEAFISSHVSEQLEAEERVIQRKEAEARGRTSPPANIQECGEVLNEASEQMEEIMRTLRGDRPGSEAQAQVEAEEQLEAHLLADGPTDATATAGTLTAAVGGGTDDLDSYGTGVQGHNEADSRRAQQASLRADAVSNAPDNPILEMYGTGQDGDGVDSDAALRSGEIQAVKREFLREDTGTPAASMNPDDYGTGVSNSADGSPEKSDGEKRKSFARKLQKAARSSRAAGR